MKKIRYTKGPSELELGNQIFKIGEFANTSDEMAIQALLKERVAEYGFEEELVQTSALKNSKNKIDSNTYTTKE